LVFRAEGLLLVLSELAAKRIRLAAFWPLGALIAMTPALATTPDRSWRGVDRVSILCQVTSSKPAISNTDVSKTLCQRIKAAAERDAPVPVQIVGYGDPSLRGGDTVALLVQAAVVDVAPERPGLILSMRTERSASLDGGGTYFGPAPRLASFTSAADGAAWDGAIAASLSELLPWLRPAGKGELSPMKRERD
jgi:hypothetical protein